MTSNASVCQEILQRTLREIQSHAASSAEHAGDPCVICLEQLSDPAVIQPCGHGNLDFACLMTWASRRPSCPLCKSPITCVHYDLTAAAGAKTFVFPAEDIPTSTTASWHGIDRGSAPEYHPSIVERRSRRGRRWRGGLAASQLDAAVSRRSYIYRHGLYSRYVGNNDISRYREITPEVFNREPRLVSRAQRWIRRELQAFTFPYGSGFGESHATSVTAVGVPPPSYAGNPEFLLEYIIAILRTVDIRGAAGHAETLLCSYFGGPDNTRLFLHELNSFLRSPFSDLRQWDEAVQYGEHIPTSRRDEEARLRRL